jgi:hypothetical protein
MHVAFQIPYMYNYITKLCRQQAKVIQDYKKANACNNEHGEARHRKYKKLKVGGGQAYDHSSD